MSRWHLLCTILRITYSNALRYMRYTNSFKLGYRRATLRPSKARFFSLPRYQEYINNTKNADHQMKNERFIWHSTCKRINVMCFTNELVPPMCARKQHILSILKNYYRVQPSKARFFSLLRYQDCINNTKNADHQMKNERFTWHTCKPTNVTCVTNELVLPMWARKQHIPSFLKNYYSLQPSKAGVSSTDFHSIKISVDNKEKWRTRGSLGLSFQCKCVLPMNLWPMGHGVQANM